MPDSTLATILILGSAFLHAILNVVFKSSGDRMILWAVIGLVSVALMLPATLLVPPPTAELWPFILFALFSHTAYQLLLATAYRHGDLTFTYPVSRGLGPALVAVAAVILVIEPLTLPTAAGVGLISLGAILAGVFQAGRLEMPDHRRHAFIFTGLTGASIALYTTVDAIGIRLAANPFTFIVWLFLVQGVAITLLLAAWRRREFWPSVTRSGWRGVVSAISGLTSYTLALLAFWLGSLAETAALRETSILFAIVLAYLTLRERPSPAAIAGVLLIAAGALVLKLT